MKRIADLNRDFAQQLLLGNKNSAKEITQIYLNEKDNSVISLYENLFKTALYRIGELWEINKITVADEHLATAVVESLMNDLFVGIVSPERKNKRVVVGCVEGEQHQVGSKMVADVFEMNGWDAFYLGANTPLNDLLPFLEKIKPEIIAISAAISWHIPILELWGAKIEEHFPQIQIIAGGQALFVDPNSPMLEKTITTISNLVHLEKFIKTL